MKILFSSFVALCLSFYSSFAMADSRELVEKVTTWVSDFKFDIRSINADNIKGSTNQKLYNGMKFNISRYGADIIHPITGKFVSKQKASIGTAVATKSDMLKSNNRNVKMGDSIEISKPIQISFLFDNISTIDATEIKSEFIISPLFKVVKNSDYKISCSGIVGRSSDSSANCIFSFKDNKILSSSIDVVSISIEELIDNRSVSFTVDGDVESGAIGVIGYENNRVIIALANRDSIRLYTVTDNYTFVEFQDITAQLDDILNVELVDIDNDNVSELIVTNINGIDAEEASIVSQIYKYDGEKYYRVKSRLPYLFRTFYSGGQKILIAQKYSALEFVGEAYTFSISDGEYKVDKKIAGSVGLPVFGFGISNYGEAHEKLISIDKSGAVAIRDKTGLLQSTTTDLFGDNNRYLYYNKEIITGSNRNEAGEEEFIVDRRKIAVPIYQRIIEVHPTRFLLLKNITVGRDIKGLNTFSNSNIGLYSITGSSVNEFVRVDRAEPSITELDIVNINSERYILSINNINSERYKTGKTAKIELFKLK